MLINHQARKQANKRLSASQQPSRLPLCAFLLPLSRHIHRLSRPSNNPARLPLRLSSTVLTTHPQRGHRRLAAPDVTDSVARWKGVGGFSDDRCHLGDMGCAGDFGHNGGLAVCQCGCCHEPAHKCRADNAFVDKGLAQLQLAAGVHERHDGACARAARRAVQHAGPRARLVPGQGRVGHDHGIAPVTRLRARLGVAKGFAEHENVRTGVVNANVRMIDWVLLASGHLDGFAQAHNVPAMARLQRKPHVGGIDDDIEHATVHNARFHPTQAQCRHLHRHLVPAHKRGLIAQRDQQLLVAGAAVASPHGRRKLAWG
eukprot:m.155663 g.155663  ORF g.155663 m.155663 type:complete len:315 (-) comp17538_c0_seq3:904-1848(-)